MEAFIVLHGAGLKSPYTGHSVESRQAKWLMQHDTLPFARFVWLLNGLGLGRLPVWAFGPGGVWGRADAKQAGGSSDATSRD